MRPGNKLSNHDIQERYYLISQNRNLTVRTIESQKIDLRLFTNYIKKPYEEVTHNDVEDFLFHCQLERGNCSATVNRKYATLSSFFKLLIKKDYLDMRNPMDKLEKIKVRKRLPKHLDKSEWDQFKMHLVDYESLRNLCIILLFYSSGCRLSELWQQNRDSLDFAKRQFIVRGKGEKERVCIFSKEAAEYLQAYIDSREDVAEALFISRQGNRLARKSIQDAVKVCGKRAGLRKNIHPHIFRHTRATHLLQAGLSLEKIQKLLGHENIATTQVYAHSSINDAQGMIDVIDGNDS